MEPEFLTFQRFSEPLAAKQLTDFLSTNRIPYQIEASEQYVNPTFNFAPVQEIRIKLRKVDFLRVNQLLDQETFLAPESIDPNHPILAFSDDELLEIVLKPDEWSYYDYKLAQYLLKQHGIEVGSDLLKAIQKQRISELGRPEDRQRTWIIAGYCMAILGGPLGIFIGLHLALHKKTLPNGDRIHAYSAQDRVDGNRITIVGVTMLILFTIIRVLVS